MRRRLFVLLVAVAAVLGFAPSAWANVDGSDVIVSGNAPNAGSLKSLGLRPLDRVLGIASSATGGGYWMVAGDGGIFSFGDAPFLGSMGSQALNKPMVGMATTKAGRGYWMFAGDGGIFAFGDAPFLGSLGAQKLNAPIVAMARTSSGNGYWMVGADGGVFAFGDAPFLGSTGDHPPASAIAGMATLANGTGYWIFTTAGQVIPFGAAPALGDLTTKTLTQPVVGMAATPDGKGYWLAQADGQVWNFGNAAPSLATPTRCLAQPIVGMASRPQGDGLWLATAPRPAMSLDGLPPLTQLDRENDDFVAMLKIRQACEAPAPPTSIAWIRPVAGAPVTEKYGPRIHPIYKLSQFHRGVDLGGRNTTVVASAPGTVVEVSSRVGYGNVVVIDHGGRLATVYAHLASAAVTEGQTVVAGQTIATMGHTGFATAAHLHYEIRVEGETIDPEPFLGA